MPSQRAILAARHSRAAANRLVPHLTELPPQGGRNRQPGARRGQRPDRVDRPGKGAARGSAASPSCTASARRSTIMCTSSQHLLRYCARAPFALERLSVTRDPSGRIARGRSHPPGARPQTGVSSCRPMTTATSFRRRPTSCPRSTSTASERWRTRGVAYGQTANWEPVCAEARKTPPGGCMAFWGTASGRQKLSISRLTNRPSAARPLRKCR